MGSLFAFNGDPSNKFNAQVQPTAAFSLSGVAVGRDFTDSPTTTKHDLELGLTYSQISA